MQTPIQIESWGKVDQQDVNLYHLCNANGLKVAITNFGASVQAIVTPDKHGHFIDIALGYNNLQGYIDDPFYMGAIAGRSANRIATGLIKLDEQNYQLTLNKKGFHHHGGTIGFNKKVWQAAVFADDDKQSVRLEYLSVDGEEGYPGNLTVTVTYILNNHNQLLVEMAAKTDKTTIVNLTQHSYFNLAGHNNGSIGGHELMLTMNTYLPVNEMHVPKGKAGMVENTPFDFRVAKPIGRDIDTDNEQLNLGKGYDHTWPIKTAKSAELLLAAKISEPVTGRGMNVYTTEPVLHLYTGNFLDASVEGKSGVFYDKRSGFCLETQQYPDAPNQPEFPDTVLKAGEEFISQTIFEFKVDRL